MTHYVVGRAFLSGKFNVWRYLGVSGCLLSFLLLFAHTFDRTTPSMATTVILSSGSCCFSNEPNPSQLIARECVARTLGLNRNSTYVQLHSYAMPDIVKAIFDWPWRPNAFFSGAQGTPSARCLAGTGCTGQPASCC